MSLGSVHPNLQIWLPRLNGYKASQNIQIHYSSGQSNPPLYLVSIWNHRNLPDVPVHRRPRPTGRLECSTDQTYWQGDKIQAQEIANTNPLGLSMSTDVDMAYANLHGFQMESIPAGAGRFILVKINGTGLTFIDQMVIFDILQFAPA